jgi:V/A-type H+/Na+-transporting ATPase subunit E
MAEQLQELLERIQAEGVNKADAAAREILDKAHATAAGIVKEAEASGQKIRDQGEADATAFVERAKAALAQAARDVVISVEQSVQSALRNVLRHEVDKALTSDTLISLLKSVVESYVRKTGSETRLEVLLSPEDQAALSDYLLGEFVQQMRSGIELRGDGGIPSGFRVSETGGNVTHDFSRDAIVEAMCAFLRPQVAQLLRTPDSPLPR